MAAMSPYVATRPCGILRTAANTRCLNDMDDGLFFILLSSPFGLVRRTVSRGIVDAIGGFYWHPRSPTRDPRIDRGSRGHVPGFRILRRMPFVDIISRKRDGRALSREDIDTFVTG